MEINLGNCGDLARIGLNFDLGVTNQRFGSDRGSNSAIWWRCSDGSFIGSHRIGFSRSPSESTVCFNLVSILWFDSSVLTRMHPVACDSQFYVLPVQFVFNLLNLWSFWHWFWRMHLSFCKIEVLLDILLFEVL